MCKVTFFIPSTTHPELSAVKVSVKDPIRFIASCNWSGICDVFNRISELDLKYAVFVTGPSGPSRWNSVSKDKFHFIDLQITVTKHISHYFLQDQYMCM